VDGVKLDLSFLSKRAARPEDLSLLGTIGAVARALKLRVAAHGVENETQMKLLKQLGCVEAQGLHLGAPAPPTEIGERLEKQATAALESEAP